MNDYIQPKQRVPKPPRKPFLWLCIAAIVLGIFLGWFAEVRADEIATTQSKHPWSLHECKKLGNATAVLNVSMWNRGGWPLWKVTCYMQPLVVRFK